MVGDIVPGETGSLRVVRSDRYIEDATVFNLEVEGAHTYFVGELGAWVHNGCDGTPTATNPANGWKTVTRQMSQAEVNAWNGRSTLPQPRNNVGGGRGRIDVSQPGGPPGGGTANPVTVQFDVPADAVQPIGNAGWGTIYNEGRAVPMQNFTVLP